MNGEENYIDDVHAPFPAIRYLEPPSFDHREPNNVSNSIICWIGDILLN